MLMKERLKTCIALPERCILGEFGIKKMFNA